MGARWVTDRSGARPGLAVIGGPAPDLAAALVAWLLADVGRRPGFLLPHRSRNFGEAAREGTGPVVVAVRDGANPWTLRPAAALVCGAPGAADRAAARDALGALPPDAPLVVDRGDPDAVALAAAHPAAATRGYGLEGEAPSGPPPEWLGAPYAFQGGVMPVELFVGGTSCGRVFSPLVGAPLARLAVGAVALAAEHAAVPVRSAAAGLRGFLGVEGFLEPRAVAAGVTVVAQAPHPDPRRLAVALGSLRASRPRARLHVLGAAEGPGVADVVDRVVADDGADSPARAVEALRGGDALVVTAGRDAEEAATAALVARGIGRTGTP